MAKLYLIRHGEPSGTWDDSHDPGLTELGHSQAKSAAERLRLLQPKRIVSSPLRRAFETAKPLVEALEIEPVIAKQVAEIPTPGNISLQQRGDWLRTIMTGTWNDAASDLRQWRDGVVACLNGLQEDTAIYSHFVAINVALGASIGDDRVVCFRPTHASVTVFETNGRVISLVELGQTAETTVT